MFDEITLNATSPHRSSWAQVAINLVILTTVGGRLNVVLVNRTKRPFEGAWVLPGARLLQPQGLDEAALEVLFEEIGPLDVKLEQFRTFGAPARDPRRWTLAVGFVGVTSTDALEPFAGIAQGLELAEVLMEDEVGCALLRYDGNLITLGFDHAEIVYEAVRHLRSGGEHSMMPFRFLAPEFTLLELQQVHEAIGEGELNKPLFRKQVLKRVFADGSRLELTGRVKRSRNRPARYYRLSRPD